ncbi:MAG: Uma2 family endonuclease, partial [Planctomycetes bacterium]|nr:Uma2 family endonuclease [Planctomycetota bacterium]
MSIASTQLMTAEEFYEFANRAEFRDRPMELERGVVVEMNQPGVRHGLVCANVARLLGNFVFERGRGYVVSNDSGVILERDPDTVNGPDVSLFDVARTYEEVPIRYDEELPVLAVEVISPTDRLAKLVRRVNRFLHIGIPLVWVLDPDARNVTVYSKEADEPTVLEEGDTLAAVDVLPGLRIAVSECFAVPGESPQDANS